MARKKPLINKYEAAILKVIHDARRPMSIHDIAQKAGISWVTCRKYIKKLAEKNILVEEK